MNTAEDLLRNVTRSLRAESFCEKKMRNFFFVAVHRARLKSGIESHQVVPVKQLDVTWNRTLVCEGSRQTFSGGMIRENCHCVPIIPGHYLLVKGA